eukprot:tig00020554_g10882.t1
MQRRSAAALFFAVVVGLIAAAAATSSATDALDARIEEMVAKRVDMILALRGIPADSPAAESHRRLRIRYISRARAHAGPSISRALIMTRAGRRCNTMPPARLSQAAAAPGPPVRYLNPGAVVDEAGNIVGTSIPPPDMNDPEIIKRLQSNYGLKDEQVAAGAIDCSSGVTCSIWGANEFVITSADAAAANTLGVVNTGDTAWLLTSTALVMIMTPGLGLFYAGMAGAENAVNTIMMSFVSMGIVTVQWVVIGYSFAFGPGTRGFGSFRWVALTIVGRLPSSIYAPTSPHYAFVAFQCMFAQITPALMSGAVVGRMKFSAYVIFILAWTTICYDALAHWVWGWVEDGLGTSRGFLAQLGALDFAGGTVIHISSGWSSLVAALIVGKRRHGPTHVTAHNAPMCLIGATLLWFGWFGFNGGSAWNAADIASLACLNTHIAAASALCAWLLIEVIVDKHPSAVGASAGCVVGLVCITPGAGFVTPMASIAIGVIGAIISFGAVMLKKHVMKIDDTLDVWACHGVGGVTGAFLTGLFSNEWSNPWNAKDHDGNLYYVAKGAFYGRGVLLGYQVAGIVVGIGYAMACTAVILFALKYTIGLRVSEAAEKEGLDVSVHGNAGYDHMQQNFGAVFGMGGSKQGGDQNMWTAGDAKPMSGSNGMVSHVVPVQMGGPAPAQLHP